GTFHAGQNRSAWILHCSADRGRRLCPDDGRAYGKNQQACRRDTSQLILHLSLHFKSERMSILSRETLVRRQISDELSCRPNFARHDNKRVWECQLIGVLRVLRSGFVPLCLCVFSPSDSLCSVVLSCRARQEARDCLVCL